MSVEMKEKSYVCSDTQLNEIHKALSQEFEAVSKNQIEQKIRLYDGLFQQELNGIFLYKFEVPNDPEKKIEPDKPHILSIDGKLIDGSICLITEKYIEVNLKESYGHLIPILDVIIDLRILLDLIDRRIVLIDKEPNKFKVNSANFLFNPIPPVSSPTLKPSLNHDERKDGIPLNKEQKKAIQESLKNKLTIIWGPPGTGKTKTLQGVIGELLKNNKKVLFASNTNNAIDNLLEDFIIKDETPYEIFNDLRAEWKILRIGSQTKEEIRVVFSPEAVSAQKSSKIAIKVGELESQLKKEQEILGIMENELKLYNRAIQLKDKIIELKTKLNQIPSSDNIFSQIKNIENDKDLLFQEFLKYDPLLFSNTNLLAELAENLKNLREKISGINAQLNKLKKDFSITEQKTNELKQESDNLSKSFFKKLFNKEKLAVISKSLSEQNEKSVVLKSQIISYESQQKTLIENEAQTTGQFISGFNTLFNRIEASNLSCEQVEKLLKSFNLAIRLTGNKPFWLQCGCELYLCNEEQANKISYIRGVGSINRETIFEKFISIKNDLEHQIKKNEDLKSNIKYNIENSKNEFDQLKNLLEKNPEYWSSLKKKINTFYENKILPLQDEIESLNAKLKEIEKTILPEAQFVCCTLVKASYDETLMNCEFDVLVVDEYSMASLPQLYCVAALISDIIVLCGDHLQLQPISISKGKDALKWLKNSYFNFIETLNTESKICIKPKILLPFISMLSEQFRMPTQVSNLVKQWYKNAGNLLQDKEDQKQKNELKDLEKALRKNNGHFLKEGTIFFLDTSSIGSYHSRSSDKSPYNLINAAIVAELVRELLEDYQIDPKYIFCITPYRAQCQLTWALLKKFSLNPEKIKNNISNTVHKIQGGEKQIVIYDLTDGRQNGFTGFIKTTEINIHNVAISRSKAKLIFVGDIEKLKRLKQLEPKPSLSEILDDILKVAKVIDAKPYKDKIFLTYTVEDLLNKGMVILTEEQKNNLVILPSNTYYRALENDIQNAKHSIFLISPFITRNRWEKIKPLLIYFLEKNPQGKIKIITRPPEHMFERNKINMSAVEILNEFLNLGFEIKVSEKIHAKLVVIDQGYENAITYWGSLNPLSFKNTDDINTRLKGKELAEKFINMSLVGKLKKYEITPLRNNKLLPDTEIAVKKQLVDFRWLLAGYYHRPVGAICSNSTIEQIINILPETKEDYFQIKEFNRANFVLFNHLNEINEIISPLRVFSKMRRPKIEQSSLFD